MSFGISIGDFVAIGALAKKLYDDCSNAEGDFQDLADLCNDVALAIGATRPNDPFTVMRRQDADTINILTSGCRRTLERLDVLLGSYQNIKGIRGFGRRMGFINAKDERQSIRQRLHEHLLVITAFNTGATVDIGSLVARSLLAAVQERLGTSNAQDITKLAKEEQEYQKIVEEFAERSNLAEDTLKGRQEEIRSKLIEAAEEQQTGDTTGNTETKEISKLVKSESWHTTTATGPVPTKTSSYDPWQNTWFSYFGFRNLWPVSAAFAPCIHANVTEPVIKYSEMDAYICTLPEGWSITLTVGDREPLPLPSISSGRACGYRKEAAFYYVFNNMSCSSNNIPRTSRLYFLRNSLIDSKDAWGQPVTRFYWTPPRTGYGYGFTPLTQAILVNIQGQPMPIPDRPPYLIPYHTPCSGFVDQGNWPYDLSDELTTEFVQSWRGNMGTPMKYTDTAIDDSLPDDWTWDRDHSGRGNHKYTDRKSGVSYTVHPARFYRIGDESPTLPPGWDRRLDSLGNLFFVDHHTKSTTRQDPRYNPRIDKRSGLPSGWNKINDKNGADFFYREIGIQLIGTYNPSTLNSKSMDDKYCISRAPVDGELPLEMDKEQGDLADTAANDSVQDRDTPSPAPDLLKSEDLPPISPDQRKLYYRVFESASKNVLGEVHPRISLEVAMAQMSQFEVPERLARAVLSWADKDNNGLWNPEEYAQALHMIRNMLEKNYSEDGIPPINDDLEGIYSVAFKTVQRPGQILLDFDDVKRTCQHWSLPQEHIRELWLQSDLTGMKQWNFDDFVAGYHRGEVENKRQMTLHTLSGLEKTLVPEIETSHNPPVGQRDVADSVEETQDERDQDELEVQDEPEVQQQNETEIDREVERVPPIEELSILDSSPEQETGPGNKTPLTEPEDDTPKGKADPTQ